MTTEMTQISNTHINKRVANEFWSFPDTYTTNIPPKLQYLLSSQHTSYHSQNQTPKALNIYILDVTTWPQPLWLAERSPTWADGVRWLVGWITWQNVLEGLSIEYDNQKWSNWFGTGSETEGFSGGLCRPVVAVAWRETSENAGPSNPLSIFTIDRLA